MSSMSSVAPVPLTPPDLNCNVGQPPGGPEHEVQELLKFKMRWGRPYVLVHWAGHDVLGDTWEQLHNLTNCEEAITTFELAPGSPLPHSVSPPPAAAAAPLHSHRQGSPWTLPGPLGIFMLHSGPGTCCGRCWRLRFYW